MIEEENDEPRAMSAREKKLLRGFGHHLPVTVIVGREGVSAALVAALEDELSAHELVKVKLGPGCPVDRQEAAQRFCAARSAALVHFIGKIIVLYRANPDLPPAKQALFRLRDPKAAKRGPGARNR